MSAPDGLKRTMGLPSAVAAACGLVVASTTLVSLGQGFGLGGGGFIWAMVLALVINLFVAFTYAELSGIVPKAGSIDHYTMPALGRFLAMMAVISGYVIVTIFAGSAEASVPGLVLNQFFPGIPPMVTATVLVLILTYINLRGVEIYAWVQLTLTVIMMATLVIMGVVGLVGGGPATPVPAGGGFNPMGMAVLSLTALGFWLFVGVEYVTPMAEEIKNPGKIIPMAMIVALGVIMLAMILFGYASIRFVPLETLAGSAAPHVDAAQAIMGAPGAAWMGIVTVLAAASTVNTLLAALPRLLYGMAEKGQAPALFGRLHAQYKTPTWGTAFIALCILVPIWIGITDLQTVLTYIMAGAFAWFVSYIIAHLNVIVLRMKYPNVHRPFKTPLFPLPQILGIVSMVYVMINIFPDPAVKAAIYQYALIFLGLAAVVSAVWVGVVQKQPLFKPVPLEDVMGEQEKAEAVGG